MNQSQIALLKMFNFQSPNQCITLEDILKKYPDCVEGLKVLLAAELIQQYNEKVIDLQADVTEQLKDGLKLTKKGTDLLIRFQFLY